VSDCLPNAGLTVRETAKLLRVSPDKIRRFIAAGALGAINTSAVLCGRPRFIVLPVHLEAFTRARQAARPKPATRRRRRTPQIDFYPD
jgi:hypothetical protein